MGRWRVPVAQPSLGGVETEAVARVVASGWLSRGPNVEQFEAAVAKYVGGTRGVAVNSGTSALMLALRALGVGHGDEVITTSITCTATVNAVFLVGATAVLVDVEPDTLNLDPEAVAAAIGPRTKAIMPVHLFGHPAEMDPIRETAGQHGLPVLEDAAIALGARYRGRPAGSLGVAACYSFYANKHITTGEGGMVVTSDEDLYERLFSMANLGKAPHGTHEHDHIGYNFKMTEMQAAIGLAQMDRVDGFVERRRDIAARLRAAAAERPDVIASCSDERPWVRHTYFAFHLTMRTPALREAFERYLHDAGIETRPLFSYVPAQRAFEGTGLDPEAHPVAKEAFERTLYVSCSPALTDEDVAYLEAAIRGFGTAP